ncbi:unnamed protein product [Hermetia illucens]|uniref:Uncharacterized protein n=1 Tax=Hermetia illucens TaxID=343691 RepID=A0A7R8V1L1_HERIL|nr:unnamed protein product [Hermetia illucens]
MESSLPESTLNFLKDLFNKNIANIQGSIENCLEEKDQFQRSLVKCSIPGYYVRQDPVLMKTLEVLSEDDIRRYESEYDEVIETLRQGVLDFQNQLIVCDAEMDRSSEIRTNSRASTPPSEGSWCSGGSASTDSLPIFELPVTSDGDKKDFVPVPFFSEEHNIVMFHLISVDGKHYVDNAAKDSCFGQLPVSEMTNENVLKFSLVCKNN